MKSTWQLQEAKNHFSEVVEEALTHGPQTVTRNGHEAVIVISAHEYRKRSRPKNSFIALMRKSPLRGIKLDLRRERSREREIRL